MNSKHKQSTCTALHNICHQITKDCNNPRQHHIVAVALDMSKVFDAVSINELILTNIPKTIINFIANNN